MADTFLSPPSKRTLMVPPPFSKKPRSKPVVPSGHVSLRMLCHASLISAFIGKSGSTIKQLQLDTGSRIRVENTLGTDDRVIVIVVSENTPAKTLELRNLPLEDGVVVDDVSAVQEAAVRVFEKVLEVSMETGTNTVSCRLLVEGTRAGSVIGKGGKVVERLRRESGAKIRVLSGDHLPNGVSPLDEVVEIEGYVMAVKKAVVGVCGRLQECLHGEKSSIKRSGPLDSTSRPGVPDFDFDTPLQRTQVSVATTSSSPFVGRPLFPEVAMSAASGSKLQEQEVVFRILCSNDRVGGIIGRGGSIVRALQEDTGAAISIGATLSNCEERLITITSKEGAESRYSPAQRAVISVFSRSVEVGLEKGMETGLNKGSSVSARLVVPSNQVGCLLGKGGVIVSQMRKETGASISIFRGEQVPKCASDDDEVVEISGQLENVRDALYRVTSRLQTNLFPGEVVNNSGRWNKTFDAGLHQRVGDPTSVALRQSYGTAKYFDRQATARQGSGTLLLPHRLDHSPSLGVRASEMGAGVNTRTSVNLGRDLSLANGVELGCTNRAAIVTNTTVEILVPEGAVSSVYGENGSNLARIRQISGAKVVVHEPRPGLKDRTIIISGTPDETQAAQSLLHAFILTGPS